MHLQILEKSIRLWRQIVAWLLDEATFLLVNAFHKRHLTHATTRQDVESYMQRWKGCSDSDFFDPVTLRLPEGFLQGGECRIQIPYPAQSGFDENDRVVIDFFPGTGDGDLPVLFLLHGLMSASDRGYRAWARRIAACGSHAIFVHLPYHYGRTPRGYWSGELAVGPDGLRTVEGVRQSVRELRGLKAAFLQAGATGCSCWGMSYGGWVCALSATLEPDWESVLLLEPIVDFSHAIWDSPAAHTTRVGIEKNGLTREDSAPLDAMVSPQIRKLLTPVERIAFFAGEFDRVTPPSLIRELAETWGCPHYHALPQGHVGYQLMRGAFRWWTQHR